MRQRSKHRRIRLIAAGLTAAGALSLAGLAVAQNQIPAAGLSGILLGALNDRNLDDLTQTRERPLFTPARHPPKPPPPPVKKEPVVKKPKVEKPPPPPKPPSLRLIGVVMSADDKMAMVIDKSRKVKRIGLGDEFEGWTVAKVEPDMLELTLKDERSVYRMFQMDAAADADARSAVDRFRNRRRGNNADRPRR